MIKKVVNRKKAQHLSTLKKRKLTKKDENRKEEDAANTKQWSSMNQQHPIPPVLS